MAIGYRQMRWDQHSSQGMKCGHLRVVEAAAHRHRGHDPAQPQGDGAQVVEEAGQPPSRAGSRRITASTTTVSVPTQVSRLSDAKMCDSVGVLIGPGKRSEQRPARWRGGRNVRPLFASGGRAVARVSRGRSPADGRSDAALEQLGLGVEGHERPQLLGQVLERLVGRVGLDAVAQPDVGDEPRQAGTDEHDRDREQQGVVGGGRHRRRTGCGSGWRSAWPEAPGRAVVGPEGPDLGDGRGPHRRGAGPRSPMAVDRVVDRSGW